MRTPELWLYLLAAVTVLVIALRRVLHKLTPLNDEVYAKQVAIDHVHSGVAWVRFDGNIGSANPAMAKTLGTVQRDLIGSPWIGLFPPQAKPQVEQAYSQALLSGKISVETQMLRRDGTLAPVDLLLVCIHDHKSRLVGHYCLTEDRSRITELETALQRQTEQATR